MAVAFRTLDGKDEWFRQADAVFHAASTMKIPVMIELFDEARRDRLSLTYVPAPRHLGRYEDAVFPRRATVESSPAELTGKPAPRRALDRKVAPEIQEAFGAQLDPGTSDETIRRRSGMMLAVDEGVGRMVEALEHRDVLDDTLILFTSDNGFFYGEHGLSLERRLPYEESIRAPLIVRDPERFRTLRALRGEYVDDGSA